MTPRCIVPWIPSSVGFSCTFPISYLKLPCFIILTLSYLLKKKKKQSNFAWAWQGHHNWWSFALAKWPMKRSVYCFFSRDDQKQHIPLDHLLLDKFPNIGPLVSRWELDKFKNCWKNCFRNSKILTLLYQQFSNLLIFQRDMSGPRLGPLSNDRWSSGIPVSRLGFLIPFQNHLLLVINERRSGLFDRDFRW
jgi:hypothetical protein